MQNFEYSNVKIFREHDLMCNLIVAVLNSSGWFNENLVESNFNEEAIPPGIHRGRKNVQRDFNERGEGKKKRKERKKGRDEGARRSWKFIKRGNGRKGQHGGGGEHCFDLVTLPRSWIR